MKHLSTILFVAMLVLALLQLDYDNLGDFELNKKGYILLGVSLIYGLSAYFRNKKLG